MYPQTLVCFQTILVWSQMSENLELDVDANSRFQQWVIHINTYKKAIHWDTLTCWHIPAFDRLTREYLFTPGCNHLKDYSVSPVFRTECSVGFVALYCLSLNKPKHVSRIKLLSVPRGLLEFLEVFVSTHHGGCRNCARNISSTSTALSAFQ